MKVKDSSSVKFYNLTAGKSFPSWLTAEQRRFLKDETDYSASVVLLQDFTMPEASHRLKITRDQRNLFVSGTYKPTIKCFEVSELSMKFERAIPEDIVDFEVLTDDFSKLCMLGANNNMYFHAKYGHYYNIRCPTYGRCIRYDRATCDLFLVGASSDIFRFNLEAGHYLDPLPTQFSDGINVMNINPLHSLLAFGGDDGFIECRDPRLSQHQSPLARIDIAQVLRAAGELDASDVMRGITSLEFHNSGLMMGIGTGSGHVLAYDLRAPNPLYIKDHRNESAIHSLCFDGKLLVSADKRGLKMWEQDTGTQYATLETDYPCNNVLIWPNSGLILAAGEAKHCMSYYCPSMGKAPRWCSFLDNITEELEEKKALNSDEVFQDFRFLTRDELNEIGGQSLIGSRYLKPYMHGFFINVKLFKQMRAAANPHLWEEEKKKRVQEKMAKMNESRISGPEIKGKPKTNKSNDGVRALDDDEQDERFKALSNNPDFAKGDFVEVKKGKKVRMFEAREDMMGDGDAVMFTADKRRDSAREAKRPMGERLQDLQDKPKHRAKYTSSEMKFVPQEMKDKMSKKKEEKKARIEHNKDRRKMRRDMK